MIDSVSQCCRRCSISPMYVPDEFRLSLCQCLWICATHEQYLSTGIRILKLYYIVPRMRRTWVHLLPCVSDDMTKFFTVICNVCSIRSCHGGRNIFHHPPAQESGERITLRFDVSSLFYWVLSFSGRIVHKNTPTHTQHSPHMGHIINYISRGLPRTKVFIHYGVELGYTLLSNERSTFYWNCSAMWKIFRRINFLWSYLWDYYAPPDHVHMSMDGR